MSTKEDTELLKRFWKNVFAYAEKNNSVDELRVEMQGSFWKAKDGEYNPSIKKLRRITKAVGIRKSDWGKLF